tara:strand:- start:681 stop:1013 length:333 start_codon:yes stop_codon:yes gene_type:complete
MVEFLYDELAIEQSKQILELNELVVTLQKENMELKSAIEDISKHVSDLEEIPVPPSVIKQVLYLEAKISKLENDIKYYKKFVGKDVIINRVNKITEPVRSGGIPISKKKI